MQVDCLPCTLSRTRAIAILMLVCVHVCRSIVPLRDADGAITHHIGMQTFSLVKDQGHTIGGSHAVQQMGGLTGAAPACTHTVCVLASSFKGIW